MFACCIIFTGAGKYIRLVSSALHVEILAILEAYVLCVYTLTFDFYRT
jgi:hypothetical protein